MADTEMPERGCVSVQLNLQILQKGKQMADEAGEGHRVRHLLAHPNSASYGASKPGPVSFCASVSSSRRGSDNGTSLLASERVS